MTNLYLIGGTMGCGKRHSLHNQLNTLKIETSDRTIDDIVNQIYCLE